MTKLVDDLNSAAIDVYTYTYSGIDIFTNNNLYSADVIRGPFVFAMLDYLNEL
jgi:hypothetical protein